MARAVNSILPLGRIYKSQQSSGGSFSCELLQKESHFLQKVIEILQKVGSFLQKVIEILQKVGSFLQILSRDCFSNEAPNN